MPKIREIQFEPDEQMRPIVLNSPTKLPRLAWVRQKYTAVGGAERFIEQALPSLIQQGFQLAFYTRTWPKSAGLKHVEPVICNPWYLGNIWRDWSFTRAVRQKHVLRQSQIREILQSHERIIGCDIFRAGDGVHAEWLKERKRAASTWEHCKIACNPYHYYLVNAERHLFKHPGLQAVICNSEMVRQEVMQHFQLPIERLHLVYNAVDHKQFHPGLREHRLSIRRQHHIPEDAFLLLFVGSGYQRKGLRSALLALSRLPQEKASCTWLLVAGQDKKWREYRQIAQTLGIHSRVIFAGPQPKIAPFYGAADLFILPTLYDPCPNAALEAMASGLPIITSTKSGAAEIALTHQAGLIADALDIETLASHIVTFMDKSNKNELTQRATAAVALLTQERMLEQLITIYRNCY